MAFVVADDFVLFVQYKNPGPMNRSFLRREASKAHNREAIANLSEMRCGAVQFDNSALRLPVNRLGFETFAVVQISDEDFFVLEQPNQFSQIR